ncbi:MAG: GNAT family N-acetyltransferase [Eubacterium sp.]|nr:GNAT family N-acetyltransferase [Lachnospiraceae bacterium]MBO5486167.1 GNAT family N-acetyltransferase [Eubacterium sp.]
MKNITTRQFSVLSDCGKIYQFMLDIYEKDWRNGVPAPFFEYAFASFSSWMDISYSHKNCIWEDNGEIVGFCFYENPITDIYFSLKPGYEELAPEMIAYADKHMPHKNNKIQLILFGGQDALMKAAAQTGYHRAKEAIDMQFDFKDVLDYPLPEGFHFVSPEDVDMKKVDKCAWKGFDHEESEGLWQDNENQNCYLLQTAPHATTNLASIIADKEGEYACFAGMWWTPENKLAYMEPLCTIPEYRNMGLASAALSDLYRRMKKLGATHMTGGINEFYKNIGYKPAVQWTFWQKNSF